MNNAESASADLSAARTIHRGTSKGVFCEIPRMTAATPLIFFFRKLAPFVAGGMRGSLNSNTGSRCVQKVTVLTNPGM